jgi:hypothetical protein
MDTFMVAITGSEGRGDDHWGSMAREEDSVAALDRHDRRRKKGPMVGRMGRKAEQAGGAD